MWTNSFHKKEKTGNWKIHSSIESEPGNFKWRILRGNGDTYMIDIKYLSEKTAQIYQMSLNV